MKDRTSVVRAIFLLSLLLHAGGAAGITLEITNRTVECSETWTFDTPSVDDHCADTNVVLTIISTTTNALCGQTFEAIRTWGASDSCGNTNSCSQTITVVDTTPPVLMITNHAVECGEPWDFDLPTVADVCDGTNVLITILSTQTNSLCGQTFAATRVWLGTDACGNTNSCSQTITVVDTTPPVLVITNHAVECGETWDFDLPTVADACDGTNVLITILSTQTNSLCGQTFAATRVWLGTDACGNTNSCSQTITVVDTTPPVLVITNHAVECGETWDFDLPTVADVCDGTNVSITILSTQTNSLCGQTFAATRVWLGTDACGNTNSCAQTITVVDTTPPVLVITNHAVECGETWDFDLPTVADACDGTNVLITILSTQTNSLCGQTFAATRVWLGTDACGNTNSCAQTITVVDTTPPVLMITNHAVECGDVWNFDLPTVADACDGTNVTIQVLSTITNALPGELFNAVRKWLATDSCGNTNSCTQTITVVDTKAPQFLCPTNIIVREDPPESGFAPVTLPAPAATDDCSTNLTVRFTPASGTSFPVGSSLVTCAVNDPAGNTNSCVFTVKVVPYTLVVNSTDDSGPGTLRNAILDANAALGSNRIVFAFSGAGPFTIRPLSPLPKITDPLLIDGWSQTNSSGLPVIQLDGILAIGPTNSPVDGLVLLSGTSTVRGLVLNRFTIGIRIENGGSNVVQGNLIGAGFSGTNAVGNTNDGIYISSFGNLVGGILPGTANVIGASRRNGVHLDTPNAVSNLIQGNYIGVAPNGSNLLSNAREGLLLENGAANNVVDGNLIAFNGSNGVALALSAGSGNHITANDIKLNALLGIDLGQDGVSPNDANDDDSGPNGFQNFPVLTHVLTMQGMTIIEGSIDGPAHEHYELEFFVNAQTDASGFGEGESFLGAANVVNDNHGNTTFTVTVPSASPPGLFLSATATDESGDTSEFSVPSYINSPPVVTVPPTGTNVPPGSAATLCVTVIGTPPFTYQWRHNGANVAGATNSCLTIPNVSLSDAGNYSVVIQNQYGFVTSVPASLLIGLQTLPAADNFVNRILLTGATGTFAGDNTFATREAGEPKHANKPGNKSIWYKWKPPTTGQVTFQTIGSTFDTLLAVYTGSSVSNLTTIAYDEDRGGFYTSTVQFNAIQGVEYEIAIDGFAGQGGTFAISWNFFSTQKMLPVILQQPENQTVAPGANAVFTVIAVRECPDGTIPCPSDSDTTYQWLFNGSPIAMATSPTLVISNVGPASVGTYVVRVRGGQQITFSQDAILQINATGNTSENVQASDKFEDVVNAANPIVLGNSPNQLPSQFASFRGALGASVSAVVRGYTGTQVFDTRGSLSEGEVICGILGGASEWISFVAEQPGLFYLNTDGSSYDTVMAVYTRIGTNTALTQLACDDNSGLDHRDSSLSIPVTAGQTNYVVLDGVGGATGTLQLNFSLVTTSSLQSLGKTAQGANRVRLIGHAGMKFTIQGSANLQQWSSLITTNSTLDTFDFTDNSSTNVQTRYYRALMQP
jgi:hypothetical protein